jgi:hypothetical protein
MKQAAVRPNQAAVDDLPNAKARSSASDLWEGRRGLYFGWLMARMAQMAGGAFGTAGEGRRLAQRRA